MTIIDHSIRTYPVHKIKDIRHRLRRNGSGDIILKYGKKRVFKLIQGHPERPRGSRYPEKLPNSSACSGTGKVNHSRSGKNYSPLNRIRANSRLVVRLTRQSSSTAATDRPMMNPIQMPRAPMAGTIQFVRPRM